MTLDGDAAIVLTTANGTVDFASTVNADGAEGLTIRSGTGAVGFSGVIGGTGSLGALTINATSDSQTGNANISIVDIGDSDTVGAAATNIGNANTNLITLSGTTFKHGAAVYTTKADDVIKLTRTAGAGNATFTLANATLEFAGGNILLSNGVDLVANTGNKALTVLGVRGTSYEDVTLTTTGTLTVGTGGIGSGTQIEDVSLDGTSIVLKGNITTAGTTVGGTNNVGDVDFDGAVTIDGAITITTDVSNSTVNDGKIDFDTNTINAEGSDTDSLTLTSGSGTITLGGAVGGNTGLSSLEVNATALNIAANITTADGLIDINAPVTLTGAAVISSGSGGGNVDFSSTIGGGQNLDILSGSGNVIITGNIGATALTSLDINQSAGTGDITISGKIGTADASGAGVTRIGNDGMTGTLTFGGIDYNTTGTQTYEADHIVMSGADPDFKTDNDNISFKDGGITLATTSNLTVDTTDGAAGNILIEGAIAGTSGGGTTTVTLEAGSGSVSVAGMGTDIGNCLLYTSPSPRDCQ